MNEVAWRKKKNFTSWWSRGRRPVPEMENRAAAPAQRTVFENLFGPPSCLTTLGYLLRPSEAVGGWGRPSGHSRREEGELGVVVDQVEDGADVEKGFEVEIDFEERFEIWKQFVETVNKCCRCRSKYSAKWPIEINETIFSKLTEWIHSKIFSGLSAVVCTDWWRTIWKRKQFLSKPEKQFLIFRFYRENPTRKICFAFNARHRFLRKCVQRHIGISNFGLFLPKKCNGTYGGPPGLRGVRKFSKFPRTCRRGPSWWPTTLQSPRLFYSSKITESDP